MGSALALHRRDTRYSWYVAVAMCLSFSFSYMDRALLQLLVAPIEHSFSLSDTGMGLLQGAAFASFYTLLEALGGERADLDGPGAGGLGPLGRDPAQPLQDAEAGSVTLLGMLAAGHDGDDQGLGVGADGGGVATEAGFAPASVMAVRARHVLRQGGVPLAAIAMAPHVCCDAAAAVEQLDGAGGDARLDLLADQAVRYRIVEAQQLDMIVDADPGALELAGIVWAGSGAG